MANDGTKICPKCGKDFPTVTHMIECGSYEEEVLALRALVDSLTIQRDDWKQVAEGNLLGAIAERDKALLAFEGCNTLRLKSYEQNTRLFLEIDQMAAEILQLQAEVEEWKVRTL